jgi:Domain of unknown function (DUF5753)
VCDAAPERTEELVAEQRAVAGMWVSYQRLNRAGLRQAQASVRSLFEETALLRSYQPRIIPGLLQTADYTRLLLETVRDRQGAGVDDVAQAVAERMDRQRMLRQMGHRFFFVLEEAVLHYRIYDASTLRSQLLHLRAVARLPAVSLGIIPQLADRRRVLAREAFTIFDSHRVSVELVSGFLSLSQPHEVRMYIRDFIDLADIAVYGRAARTLITNAVAAID